jgi:hypothetical protein
MYGGSMVKLTGSNTFNTLTIVLIFVHEGMKLTKFTTQMEEAEFVGKVNRYGSEFRVYLNPEDRCLRITDEDGIELKCGTKKIKEGEDVLELVPKILRSVGL